MPKECLCFALRLRNSFLNLSKVKREKEEKEVTYANNQEKYYKRDKIKKEGTYSWFLHNKNLDVLSFLLNG